MSEKRRWLVVVLFAVAMAWMESATVVYLRTLVGRIDPYQREPLPISAGLSEAEVVREAATLIMLLTVGLLAGRTWRSRIGYFAIAFGVWDILYYAFLAIIGGWPRTLMDWDVLFLIPLPWWGPILSPMLIAALLVIGGTLISLFDAPERPVWPGRWSWVLNFSGVLLALYVFMSDAIRALPGGVEAVRAALPERDSFNWLLFTASLVLMAAPIVDVILQIRKRNSVEVMRPSQSPLP